MTLPFEVEERPAERLRRSAHITFFLHLLLAAAALPVASSFMGALTSVAGEHPLGLWGWTGGAALLETLSALLRRHGIFLLLDIGLAASLTWLLALPIRFGWLAALAGEEKLLRCARAGIRYLPWAVAVDALLLLPLLLALLLGAALVGGVHALTMNASVAFHDSAVLIALLVALLPLALWATWRDLARAALVGAVGPRLAVSLGPWDAVQRGRRKALRAFPAYVGLRLISLVLFSLGWLAVGQEGPLLALLITQLLALARTFLRGLWLAHAVMWTRPIHMKSSENPS